METSKLEVQLRDDMSKHHLKEMRRQGRTPGSVYGKGKPTLALEVGVSGLVAAVKTDAGIHTIIELKVGGAKRGEGGTAVIKTVQRDPLTRRVLHVDFERVALSDVIVTEVPIEIQGDCIGVREGGIVETVTDHVQVRSRADQIPPHVMVDVTDLKIGAFVHGSDVVLPEGVELASRPEDILVAVRHPHVHAVPKAEAAEEEAAAEAEAAKPETEAEEAS